MGGDRVASDLNDLKKVTNKATSQTWTPHFAGVEGAESKSSKEAFEQVKKSIESCLSFVWLDEAAANCHGLTTIKPSRYTKIKNDGGIYYDVVEREFNQRDHGSYEASTYENIMNSLYVLRIHPDLGSEIQVFGYDYKTKDICIKAYKASVNQSGVTLEYVVKSSKPKF